MALILIIFSASGNFDDCGRSGDVVVGIIMIVSNFFYTESMLKSYTEERASDGDHAVVVIVMMPIVL